MEGLDLIRYAIASLRGLLELWSGNQDVRRTVVTAERRMVQVLEPATLSGHV